MKNKLTHKVIYILGIVLILIGCTSDLDIEVNDPNAFLVDEFYKKVLKDEVIGYLFTEVVELSWDKHIPVMYDFWETVLLGNMKYKGN